MMVTRVLIRATKVYGSTLSFELNHVLPCPGNHYRNHLVRTNKQKHKHDQVNKNSYLSYRGHVLVSEIGAVDDLICYRRMQVSKCSYLVRVINQLGEFFTYEVDKDKIVMMNSKTF